MAKGLTMTLVFEAQSLNYDEGFGNISTLKKIRRGDGETYTFSSRQSLRYSIIKQGVEQFGWKLGDVEAQGSGGKKVMQFTKQSSIKDSAEIDLFGYMKTKKKEKPKEKGISETVDREVEIEQGATIRVAPVRLTPAISIEPYNSDIEFLTNKGLADREEENPNIANIEQHRSLYKYTVTIDLDRIGVDENDGSNLEANEKAMRVQEFLEVIKTLYRDIKGRREDLKPLFVIGGVYDIKNPFFMNAVRLTWKNGKPIIDENPINQILSSEYAIKENDENKKVVLKNITKMGIRSGFFADSTLFKDSPETAIDGIKSQVQSYYEGTSA